ncbi:MAG: UDP-N-acetylmuramate--L-alanine ligase [Candidatus Pacebacteria bacterium]|nr:UDP-N-acetylmuramate--L-alanine ligase [Candidatus Paceibacterota bacterium]
MEKYIHMVGVGGIGMSALAQLYTHQGVTVTGSDRGASPITELLAKKGVVVAIGHEAMQVPDTIDMLVYSDAVPANNPERLRAREHGVRELSYFEALGEATSKGVSIVVSGTHGKTTTTAMIAKVLVDLDKDPTVICGSVMSEFGSNFRAGRPDLFVIEGCEYRRHFLHLHPHILLINNIELDHTDYYANLADMQSAFRSAVEHMPETATIVTDTSSNSIRPILHGVVPKVVPYQDMSVPHLHVPGAFNVSNARATKATVYTLYPDLHEEDINSSLASFKGTWRRFEYKGITNSGAVVYDDYAHHPTAVRGTLKMVRKEFPNKKLVVVFHPHLYSRTHDFMEEFASALALADEVLLAPIYAAREDPIEGVTSMVLAEKITALGTPAHALDSLDAVVPYLTSERCELTPDTLLLTMGAGDVYRVADTLVA